MAVHRRAFALILVLMAVGVVFALAMQGATAMRTALAEADAMRTRATLTRDASSVASIALLSLTSGDPRRADAIADRDRAGGASAPATPPPVDDADIPEMPQEMKEFLLGLLQDREPEDGVDAGASSGAPTGLAQLRTGGPLTTMRRNGLPGRSVRIHHNGRAFDVAFVDGAGLINLNEADEEQLVAYFSAKGIEPPRNIALAHQILDWRDEDSVPRARGAERDAYERLGITIRNGPFEMIEELLYLPAMSRDLFRRVRDDITLIGDGTIHAGTAPREALISVGVTPAAADKIISLRRDGLLDEQALNEALRGFSRDAETRVRLAPSSVLRLTITPADGGPVHRADAIVDDDSGVTGLTVRLLAE